jgi:hypothetical protein
MCDCGRVAAFRKNGDYVCKRCSDMEFVGNRFKMTGIEDTEKSTMDKNWDYEVYWGDRTPIVGGSLLILEGWLAA